MLSRLGILGQLFGFMAEGSRKFWLLTLVIALTVVILLIVLGSVPAIGALIYPLF
jgi:hypothetical protein